MHMAFARIHLKHWKDKLEGPSHHVNRTYFGNSRVGQGEENFTCDNLSINTEYQLDVR